MKLKNVVFALLPVVVLIGLLEGGACLYYEYVYKNNFMSLDPVRLYDRVDDLLIRRNIKGCGDVWFSKYFPTRYYKNDVSYRGRIISYKKSKDTVRIFSYGGSSGAGSPWGHSASFSHFVYDELNRIKKNGRVEVMNFALGGIGSSRVLALVKETIKYQPDVILIYAGHNECYDHYTYVKFEKNRIDKFGYCLRKKFYIFRVGHILMNRLRGVATSQNLLHPKSDPFNLETVYDTEDRKFFANLFEQNMREIVDIASKHHVQVVFVNQPSNFFYEPGYKTDDEALKSLIRAMQRTYQEHKYEQTEEDIDTILSADKEASIAYFYRGLIALKEKRCDDARTALLKSIDYDQQPRRATEGNTKILKKLAGTNENAYFIGAKSKFYDYLDDGLIDGRLIVDIVHPTVEGQKIIAKAILEDYFIKQKIRSDILDYGAYDQERLWGNNIDPDYYFNVCRRYYDTKNVSESIDKALAGLNSASVQQQRISKSVWEFMFYKCLQEKAEGNIRDAKDFFNKGKAIYRSKSLLRAGANWDKDEPARDKNGYDYFPGGSTSDFAPSLLEG